MTRDEYERMRQRLEEQLRAEVAWLYEAHRIRLRALDALWGASSGLPLPEAGRTALPAVPELLGPGAPPAGRPGPPPAPPAPARTPAWKVIDAVEEALGRVGEVFDKDEILAVLDFKPRRATFYQALLQLRHEGKIAVAEDERGGRLTRYRKLRHRTPTVS